MDTNNYSVRLSQQAQATDPAAAVQYWMDEVQKFGMVNFYFRVDNEDTGESWMVCLSKAHPMMMPMEEFVELFRHELYDVPVEPSLEELLLGSAARVALGEPEDEVEVKPADNADEVTAAAEAAIAKRMASRKAQHNGQAG